MTFSYQEETATAGQTDILINIAYFDEVDIHLLVDNEYTPFTWLSRTKIKVETPFVGSERIRVIRKTDESRLRVLFSEGAAFTRVNLDEVNTQLLYLAQEAVEGNRLTDFFFSFDMHGNRITSLGDPVDPKDAVNKEYVDSKDKHLQDQLDVLDERVEFIANHPIVDGEARAFRFVADSPETVAVSTGLRFTTSTVWLNGVKLTAGYDYTVNAVGLITLLNHSMYPDDELTAYLGGILASPESVYALAEDLLKETQARVDADTMLYSKIQSTVDNVDAVTERADTIETAIDDMSSQLSTNTNAIESLDTSVSELSTTVANAVSTLDELNTVTTQHTSQIQSLDDRVTTLETTETTP
ncbi:tail fiber protein [Providencia phage vB_PstP_PS3]|uniref:Tail fiber protein n=1 Tax=Providencia phage vB_PstP_PS3 TaxID=2848038 RepID=A0A411AWB1_9CAUD|nr:tail fiber protein [Providencia phage vB_PstP_PS3]QAX92393.1 tail fiber protein [Providencia phage vB_PstP_PS3]